MGAAGFVIGTVAAQFSGAWAYWQVRGRGPGEARAAVAAGLVATAVASATYVLVSVHTWLGGSGTPWSASVFLGLCVALCQGVLFRGRPLRRR